MDVLSGVLLMSSAAYHTRHPALMDTIGSTFARQLSAVEVQEKYDSI